MLTKDDVAIDIEWQFGPINLIICAALTEPFAASKDEPDQS